MSLNWCCHAQAHFILLLSQIYYWLATAPESTAKLNITREQSILIRHLNIYTDYAIVVQAFNLAGEGPKSSVRYQKTKEDCKCFV